MAIIAAVFVFLFLFLTVVGIAAGGLVGAGIAAVYNELFDVGYPIWDAAVIGSIIGCVGIHVGGGGGGD